jgi:hypothetical protein
MTFLTVLRSTHLTIFLIGISTHSSITASRLPNPSSTVSFPEHFTLWQVRKGLLHLKRGRRLPVFSFNSSLPRFSPLSTRSRTAAGRKNELKDSENLHFNGFLMSCVFVLIAISEIHKNPRTRGKGSLA